MLLLLVYTWFYMFVPFEDIVMSSVLYLLLYGPRGCSSEGFPSLHHANTYIVPCQGTSVLSSYINDLWFWPLTSKVLTCQQDRKIGPKSFQLRSALSTRLPPPEIIMQSSYTRRVDGCQVDSRTFRLLNCMYSGRSTKLVAEVFRLKNTIKCLSANYKNNILIICQ